MDVSLIKAEIEAKIAGLSPIPKTSRAFINGEGVPFISDFVLFVDPEDTGCKGVIRFLHDRGIKVDVIDVTDPDGELIFDRLPIDADDVPILYTKDHDWYIGVGLITAAVTERLI